MLENTLPSHGVGTFRRFSPAVWPGFSEPWVCQPLEIHSVQPGTRKPEDSHLTCLRGSATSNDCGALALLQLCGNSPSVSGHEPRRRSRRSPVRACSSSTANIFCSISRHMTSPRAPRRREWGAETFHCGPDIQHCLSLSTMARTESFLDPGRRFARRWLPYPKDGSSSLT
jgi:hypothetical protein